MPWQMVRGDQSVFRYSVHYAPVQSCVSSLSCVLILWQFASEYHVWPAERHDSNRPAATASPSVLPAYPPLPTVAALATPADVANDLASVQTPSLERNASQQVTIYPRGSSEPGIPIPLYSYAQLTRLSAAGLKSLASKLRDSIEQAGGTVPPLLLSSQAEVVIHWVLDIQVHLAKQAGIDVSPLSFGEVAHSSRGLLG